MTKHQIETMAFLVLCVERGLAASEQYSVKALVVREAKKILREEACQGIHQTVSDEPPVVKKAPGKRKMPEKCDIEELLGVYSKKRKYGAVSKAAKHIGVDPATLSREMKRLQIVIP